jgi:CRP-like cAMP-binding protein/thioredoxin reductase/ferredoxin-like protein FixX
MAEKFRTVIVGSGPAGLSAAAHAAATGISHLLLEKADHLSDTVRRYQRGKHVMAAPPQLVLRADCEFAANSREKILEIFEETIKGRGVNVRYQAEVEAITGAKGDFTITLTDGQTVAAETVVLAIGTQGNPNRMACPGAEAPHVQYQLDDPTEYIDEHIVVVGGGDAGIENALGLIADPAQANTVTLLNRSGEFATAKGANVQALLEAAERGQISVLRSATPSVVEAGRLTVATPEGTAALPCDRIIARLGSAAPRKFVESLGIRFTSESRNAFPELTPTFESTAPGIYVIGALAGYPLIKHCLNQGYDVIEYIAGNGDLKPADEPILEKKFAHLPVQRSVAQWLDLFRKRIEIFRGLSTLQVREFMLDSEVRAYGPGEVVFERNSPGASLFAIAEGAIELELAPKLHARTLTVDAGSIVGEVALISGRRHGATARAVESCIAVEIPRTAALKLMEAKEIADVVNRITLERQLLEIFGLGLKHDHLEELLATAQALQVAPGAVVVNEGEKGRGLYIIRSGSMMIEKEIGGKTVFLSYIPAGGYFGEMALLAGGSHSATVRAANRSEIVRFELEAFRRLLEREPELTRAMQAEVAARRRIDDVVEEEKEKFSDVVDMYSSIAGFLVNQGIAEATDVLLIDETLCIGCDNCEKACADTHDGLSRLDREAGHTFAHLHVPTSCRHCEHPYCMTDCPPNAIHRGHDGEVFIDETCIGCGNCQRNCPYGVIHMDHIPPKKPGLLSWMLFGAGPGPGEPDRAWKEEHAKNAADSPKVAIKCDMCAGKTGGPACVRACPTGAAIRVAPENFLTVGLMNRARG